MAQKAYNEIEVDHVEEVPAESIKHEEQQIDHCEEQQVDHLLGLLGMILMGVKARAQGRIQDSASESLKEGAFQKLNRVENVQHLSV